MEAYRLGVQLYKSIDLKLDLRQPLTLTLLLLNSFTEGCLHSVEWNGGMELWNGIVE